MDVLSIHDLHKSFGSREVLTGLEMSVPEHSIYGFVGQNGAGKTTTMKIVLGLLKANSGEISVCGEPVKYGETKTNRNIGYLPDVPEFYNYMRPMEYLSLCGDISGLTNKQIMKRSQRLLALVGLDAEKRRIGTFSRGMKQRLGIAQALLNNPQLLICDEPTSALDPIGRKEILDILLAIKGSTTVVFSTHILSDVERICDHVAVLHEGRLALFGTLAEIKASHRHYGYTIEFVDLGQLNSYRQSEVLQQPAIELTTQNNSLTVTIKDQRLQADFLIKLLAEQQIVPLRFEQIEPNLESLFAEVVS